ANENWTRRWDGRNKEVLMAQNYSPEGDRAMIRELIPAFRDPRYIRVRGRPGLYLCRAETFEEATSPRDPAQIGFDAAYEFPPHGIHVATPSTATAGLDPAFAGLAYDYSVVARDFATGPTAPYRRFHGVMPSWDNTARVGRRAYLAVNSSPESYRSWLETVCNRTRRDLEGDERVVFINAWNEWGEGCHLEPDRRYGLNWLEATRAALSGASPQFSYTTAADDRLLLREQIERLGRELGLDGAGAELVLKEA